MYDHMPWSLENMLLPELSPLAPFCPLVVNSCWFGSPCAEAAFVTLAVAPAAAEAAYLAASAALKPVRERTYQSLRSGSKQQLGQF